jgi:hypothetical protein
VILSLRPVTPPRRNTNDAEHQPEPDCGAEQGNRGRYHYDEINEALYFADRVVVPGAPELASHLSRSLDEFDVAQASSLAGLGIPHAYGSAYRAF